MCDNMRHCVKETEKIDFRIEIDKLKEIDRLVNLGTFASRSHAVRASLKDYFARYASKR